MATDIAQPFYDKLRKHLETGIRWQDMSFTDEQKKRIEVCIDAYKRFANDPFMDLDTYIINKWNRTYSELYNDKKIIEFIASFSNVGQRELTKMQVRHASRLLMKNGADSGDMSFVDKGANLAFKLEALDKSPTADDMGDNLAGTPIIFISEAGKKYKGKRSRTPEEMERERKRWGVKSDQWMEMVQKSTGEYVAISEDDDEEEEEGERDMTLTDEEMED